MKKKILKRELRRMRSENLQLRMDKASLSEGLANARQLADTTKTRHDLEKALVSSGMICKCEGLDPRSREEELRDDRQKISIHAIALSRMVDDDLRFDWGAAHKSASLLEKDLIRMLNKWIGYAAEGAGCK